MTNQHIRNIKQQNNRNTQHTSFRRVAKPRVNLTTTVEKPFQHEYERGVFQNNMYFNMKSSVIAWTYIRNILLHCIPAFMLHGVALFINSTSKAVLGAEYTTPDAGVQLLLLVYGICLFFAFRKISDHLAHFNVEMLISKYRINRVANARIQQAFDAEELKEDKEFIVMDHYRQRFNKYSLFPSVKELAVEHQLHQDATKRKNQQVIDYAKTRNERLDLSNKEAEHYAAKAIADWKQEQYGGPNEYEVMVRRYKHRTTPAIRNIIEQVLED